MRHFVFFRNCFVLPGFRVFFQLQETFLGNEICNEKNPMVDANSSVDTPKPVFFHTKSGWSCLQGFSRCPTHKILGRKRQKTKAASEDSGDFGNVERQRDVPMLEQLQT